jgi:hypothetical protein
LQSELALETLIARINLLSCCALFWRAEPEQLVVAGECLLALLRKRCELVIALFIEPLSVIIALLKRCICFAL